MCWKNSESPSDKALDGQTTHTHINTHINTHTYMTYTYFPLAHIAEYISIYPSFSLSALDALQTSEAIEPPPPPPLSLSPLCLSSPGLGLAHTFPCKNHLCRFTLKPHLLLKPRIEGLMLPRWRILESDCHRVLAAKV